jgi:hypothetical protein
MTSVDAGQVGEVRNARTIPVENFLGIGSLETAVLKNKFKKIKIKIKNKKNKKKRTEVNHK